MKCSLGISNFLDEISRNRKNWQLRKCVCARARGYDNKRQRGLTDAGCQVSFCCPVQSVSTPQGTRLVANACNLVRKGPKFREFSRGWAIGPPPLPFVVISSRPCTHTRHQERKLFSSNCCSITQSPVSLPVEWWISVLKYWRVNFPKNTKER